jgi:hypothetical protein
LAELIFVPLVAYPAVRVWIWFRSRKKWCVKLRGFWKSWNHSSFDFGVNIFFVSHSEKAFRSRN